MKYLKDNLDSFSYLRLTLISLLLFILGIIGMYITIFKNLFLDAFGYSLLCLIPCAIVILMFVPIKWFLNKK